MRLSEPSTSPRRAPSSPASSEFSSASDTDVVSVECDDTDESSTSGTVATGSLSYPGETSAIAPTSPEFTPPQVSFGSSVEGDIDESPASSIVATGISSSSGEVPAPGNISSLGPVVDLSGEVTASTDLFVGDFGVTESFDANGNPSFYCIGI
jgi:hypothetical protein